MVTKRRILIPCAALALFILCAAGAFAGINHLLRPVDAAAGGESLHVEIEPGMGARQIAEMLAGKGVIRSPLLFRAYARYHQLEQKFMAGSYDLGPFMSLPEIAAKIASGSVDLQTDWFTIPEGYTVEQIAGRLAAEGLIERERFLEMAARPSPHILEQFPFLQESAANPRVEYVLEGYLFPDTYEIAAGSSGEEIICLMLRRFDALFDETLRQRCTELDITLHEVLTMASIVEREVRVDHERKLAAGVFYNRLSENYPLESCATIQYILGEVKETLSIADTKIDSPYNTYQNPGLPPGPVAAPGKESINAALYPEDTEYRYFVYKEDGTGEHYFSRTNAEHEMYKRKAAENRRKRAGES